MSRAARPAERLPLDPDLVALAKALARRLAREDYARMMRPDSAKGGGNPSEG